MRSTDISVLREDGSHYHVAAEEDTLERWCKAVYLDFSASYPDLEELASFSPPDIERFLGSVLSVRHPQSRKLLQSELKVQTLLKRPCDLASTVAKQPITFVSATVAAQRQTW